METINEEPVTSAHSSAQQPKRSKCGLCMRKVFCCSSVNQVEATTSESKERRKCCLCIPCRKRKSIAANIAQSAWQNPEHAAEDAPAESPPLIESKGFFQKLNCCKKKRNSGESRRSSMKQANVQPPDESRRKLHIDLVEFNSKMKGAIPVMPLYLAWFCAICNTCVPGLGTLLSGFFCICVGIPRFSVYDSMKARFGSLIINFIVAIAQMFCVLFCFVGWGWSIWWGTIMLKTAKKLCKIKKVEKLEQEEDKRQAEMKGTTSVNVNTTEIEAGKV